MIRITLNYFLPFLLLAVLLSSCSRKYKIDGVSSVTSLDGKMLFLRAYQNGEWIVVDSAEVLHGYFKMKGTADSVRMVTLYMDNEGIMPLVLEDGTIKVSISHSHLTAKGTPLNNKLYAFIDKRNTLEVKIEELERQEARMVLDGGNLEAIHQELSQEGERLMEEMNLYIKQFIIDNFENVLGPSVFMMMCSTLPYPVMTSEIEDIMRTAPISFKEDSFVRDYLSKAKENMKLIDEHRRLEENVAMQQ